MPTETLTKEYNQFYGTTPQGWKKCRLKDTIKILTDYTANGSFADLADNVEYLDYEDYARVVRLTDLRINFENQGIYVNEQAYNYLRKSSLHGKEILIANVGAYAGYMCEMPEVEFNATLGPNMYLVKTNDEILLSHYLYFLSLSKCLSDQLDLKATATAQPKLNKTDVKTLYLYLPTIKEQSAIINFLDEKCEKIDKVVSEIEEQIQVLEDYKKSLITETVTKGLDKNVLMKDSGIDWIGQIPGNWQIKKIKYLFKVINGSTPDSDYLDYWDGDITWITPADMPDFGYISKGERSITLKGYKSCGTTLVPSNSIVVSSRAPIGKINITENTLCTNQGCKCLVSNNLCNKYYYYFLYSQKEQLIDAGRGTTFIELSTYALSNFYALLPPIKIQEQIADYLDKECEKIDKTINDKKEQLETIKEYKKALIYEYVTGKKRVAC